MKRELKPCPADILVVEHNIAEPIPMKRELKHTYLLVTKKY